MSCYDAFDESHGLKSVSHSLSNTKFIASQFLLSYEPSSPECVDPNGELFATLLCAVNTGLEMAESPRGREAFANLGCAVVASRARAGQSAGSTTTDVNASNMNWHVNNFLSAVRARCPALVVGSSKLVSPDQLAATDRMPWWTGSFAAFNPKAAGVITFNESRVDDMVAVFKAYADAPARSSAAKQLGQRWRGFLFVFACATLHELAHLFLGYLSKGERPDTPDDITHLTYGDGRDARGNRIPGGESGRWVENNLYGGAVEFYADEKQGSSQPGVPHLLDAQAVAYKVDPDVIDRFLMHPKTNCDGAFVFPLPKLQPGITRDERRRRRLRTIGAMAGGLPAQYAVPSQSGLRAMAAARNFPEYSVRLDELRKKAANPRLPLHVVRV
ncbi:hypothetical protein O9K51_02228 [Purpureocillium lavendulum]|uniref:Uncharacterized protein n=1 Tax=Purpureocillium lavendulum TaxID=1247861 RepID=A0AB34FYX9_9HYPO|nr:hypothetical protein O9K51_02228 [Purpureocillium lavendulum]